MAEDYGKSSFRETKAASARCTAKGFIMTRHYDGDSCMIQTLNPTSEFALLFLLIMALFISGSTPLLEVNVQPPSAAIVINSDGTVIPPDAPVQRNGSVYIFRGDVTTNIGRVYSSDNVGTVRRSHVLDRRCAKSARLTLF